jgi:hypothetical protein
MYHTHNNDIHKQQIKPMEIITTVITLQHSKSYDKQHTKHWHHSMKPVWVYVVLSDKNPLRMDDNKLNDTDIV